MGKISRRLLPALATVLPLLPGACGKDKQVGVTPVSRDRQISIVALFDTTRSPHRSHQLFLLQRLTQLRAGTTFKLMDAIGNGEVQQEQLAKALTGKYDFMLVFPLDAAAAQPALERAKADGTKVIVFADGVPPSACSTAVVCSERDVGKSAAEFVIRSLRQKVAEQDGPSIAGRVVQLTAEAPGEQVIPERGAGFAATLTPESGAMLVHDAPCGAAGEETAARINEALRLQKNFDVIFAHTDTIARAAAKALFAVQPEMREHVLVVGVGGSLEMVINSEIDATIYNPPLVDLAWVLILQCIENPDFVPKPRYGRTPRAINLEVALELSRTGHPMPKLE